MFLGLGEGIQQSSIVIIWKMTQHIRRFDSSCGPEMINVIRVEVNFLVREQTPAKQCNFLCGLPGSSG